MRIKSRFRRLIVNYNKSFKDVRSRVLSYHDIHKLNKYTYMSTSSQMFATHISIIKDMGFDIVADIKNPERQIKITFDDAFLGLYDNIDIINKLEVPITLFVVTSYLNNIFPYINDKQLIELNKNPFITIGSHTHTHRRLNELDVLDIEHELTESKNILQDLLSGNINSICYPESKFDHRVVNIANKIGYTDQYSLIPGPFSSEILKNVKRRSLVQHADANELKGVLNGGDNILEKWYMLKHFKR